MQALQQDYYIQADGHLAREGILLLLAVALGTAAGQDNGHIVSMASSPALALRWQIYPGSGRCLWCCKTRPLTFLLVWLALTTHLKIAVVREENPAGRATPNCSLLLTWSQTIRDVSLSQLAEKRQKLTQPALPMTCAQAMRLRTSRLPCRYCHHWACLEPKRSTHSTLNTHRRMTCSSVKKRSRIWTSNLPSRRQFPNNPSFGCCLVIPNRALVEWPMDRELIARSCLKLPLGYESPLPDTCHMRY